MGMFHLRDHNVCKYTELISAGLLLSHLVTLAAAELLLSHLVTLAVSD